MAVEPKIEVEGLKQVQRAIRDLGDKDAKKALRLANKSAAEIVAEKAREKTPVRSGKLRASIRATAGQGFAAVTLGNKRSGYGGFIDYGNKVGAGGGVGRNDTHPRPYRAGGRIVYPALAENRQAVTDRYADEISKVINQAGLD